MARLTCKPDETINHYYYETTKETEKEDKITILNKLGKLEDIEEELGIDLITLFKALRENGIWVRWNNQIVNIEPDYLRVEIDCSKPLIGSIKIQELYFEDLDWVMDTTGKEWFMCEYGKTWALTKEELENESNDD